MVVKKQLSFLESEERQTPTVTQHRPKDTHRTRFLSQVMFYKYRNVSSELEDHYLNFFHKSKKGRDPYFGIMLSSLRPPRIRNSASLLKSFGEFLDLNPVTLPEKQKPIHALNTALLALYHISPLPALSLSISHDICFVAPLPLPTPTALSPIL